MCLGASQLLRAWHARLPVHLPHMTCLSGDAPVCSALHSVASPASRHSAAAPPLTQALHKEGPSFDSRATAPGVGGPAAAVDLIVANEHVCEQMPTRQAEGAGQGSSRAGKSSGSGQEDVRTRYTSQCIKVKGLWCGAVRTAAARLTPTGAWCPACGRPAALPRAPGQSPRWAACR